MVKMSNYKKQKADFLDSLHPDDLRNAGSFNKIGEILDVINEEFYQAVIKKDNPEEFINKAMGGIFRKNSIARNKAIDLAKIYSKYNV
jgi:hypothetical protein